MLLLNVEHHNRLESLASIAAMHSQVNVISEIREWTDESLTPSLLPVLKEPPAIVGVVSQSITKDS